MKRDLYRTIRSIRDHERGLKPNPAWVLRNRERLLMQVANSMPSVEAALKNKAYTHTIRERLVRLVRGPALAIATIISVLLGGSLASVSAAERSIPGDSLYSLKLVTEQARLAITKGMPKRVRLKAEFTIRRVQELKTIVTTSVTKKDERANKAAEILKQDLNTLKQQLDEVQKAGDDEDTAEVAKAIDKGAVEVVNALADTKKELSQDVKKLVTDAQAQAADVGIQALEVLVDAQKEGDTVTSDDLDASLAAHAGVAADMVAATKEITGLSTTGTDLLAGTSSTSALTDAVEQKLADAEQLLLEDDVDGAMSLIKEASSISFIAQKIAEEEQSALAVSAPSDSGDTSTSSTESGSETSATGTNDGSGAATGTVGGTVTPSS